MSTPTRVWSRRPVIWIRLAYLAALNSLFSAVYRFVRSHYRLWRFSALHSGTRLEGLAHLHAYLMCAWARKRVPAYVDFLAANGHILRLLRLESFPETSKDTYVRRYGFAERCWDGRHPIAGTLVDESAGSSGTPYNWLRSGKELHDVHLDTANWVRWTFPTERLFALNAFSMGAWATGTNMGIALSKVCMVKSTGPDIDKIVDTIERFGDDYDYLICAYPPFLKHTVDALESRGFDWSRTRVYGLVGGEAMTEAMRDYLEHRLVKVRSGYGASDIQIGIGGETDLSVHIRRLLVARADVREALLGPDENRVPMVFQYNPLEVYIEINDRGESLITVNNASVLSPKLRYNVGDEARVLSRRAVLSRLAELGIAGPFPDGWSVPFLLLFGRADSTVSYMGAKIYPIDVEYGLYRDRSLAAAIESFCLELDDSSLEPHPVIHVQLRAAGDIGDRAAAADALREAVVDHLAASSRDFSESLREDPGAADLRVEIHDHGSGPFAGTRPSIKNVYVRRREDH
jgi:phenylacetate-coenzyme A ligase PaaK-like adenylate-forming protein